MERTVRILAMAVCLEMWMRRILGKTSEIAVNGKYVVFTTTVPQAKITAFLGNRFVRELGDIIVLDVV